jgi:hypothetical protein
MKDRIIASELGVKNWHAPAAPIRFALETQANQSIIQFGGMRGYCCALASLALLAHCCCR